MPLTDKAIAKFYKVAKRANIDNGFEFLRLCEPKTILEMLVLLRERGFSDIGMPFAVIESLANDAAGKRLVSAEGMAFADACHPDMIVQWCELLSQ